MSKGVQSIQASQIDSDSEGERGERTRERKRERERDSLDSTWRCRERPRDYGVGLAVDGGCGAPEDGGDEGDGRVVGSATPVVLALLAAAFQRHGRHPAVANTGRHRHQATRSK